MFIKLSQSCLRRTQLEENLNEIVIDDDKKEQVMIRHLQREKELLRQSRKRFTVDDFDTIAIIGRGAFGEVKFLVLFVLFSFWFDLRFGWFEETIPPVKKFTP